MHGEGSPEAAVASTTPRSAFGLIASTVGLYRRYPWLFFALAALVVVPYELTVLAATGFGRLDQSSLSAGAGFLISVIDIALITPLVSALHVHAVMAARAGAEPRIGAVTRLGLAALPVVAAADIISWLGIVVGLAALVIPGVYLLLRWYVVAQVAAIEREGWSEALERSATLVKGHYLHVLVLAVLVFVIGFVPEFLGGLAFGRDSTDPASFMVGLVVQIFVWSFTALTAALLYFDLRARRRILVAGVSELLPGPDPVPPQDRRDAAGHDWDAGSYSDEERPPGWYVDPGASNRMRYWDAGEPPDWGKSIRTPRKVRRAMRKAGEDDSR